MGRRSLTEALVADVASVLALAMPPAAVVSFASDTALMEDAPLRLLAEAAAETSTDLIIAGSVRSMTALRLRRDEGATMRITSS